MQIFVMTLIFIFVILVCITVHEAGHFLAALAVGIHVHEFSIGWGPTLVQWKTKKKKIRISIRALPLGGYVLPATKEFSEELFPEDTVEKGANVEDKKWYYRVLFIIAGITFNIIFALIISVFFFAFRGAKDSYAQFLGRSFLLIIDAFGRMFKGDFGKDSSIPGSIDSLTKSGYSYGLIVFSLFVSININLAIFNVFPFPPLDGWRMVELAYEKTVGKPMPINVRNICAITGITLILALSVFLIVRDFI